MAALTISSFRSIPIVLVGVAVPILVVGRSMLAVALGLGVIGLMMAERRGEVWRDLASAARSPLGLMVLAAVALWLPSMAASPMPGRSFETWARVPVFLAATGLIWAALARGREGLDLALKTLVAASAGAVIPAVVALTGLPELISLLHARGWAGANPVLELKAFGAAALLLLPAVLLAGRRLGGRWLMTALASGAGLLAVILMTHNRSALAGLLAMILTGGLLIVLIHRRPNVVAAVGAALVLLVTGLMVWLHDTRGYLRPPEGVVIVLPIWLVDFQRQAIWRFALDLGRDAPWFGRGINVINFLPGADNPMPGGGLTMIPGHPHNWLIEVFVETGLIGALGLVLVVVALAIRLGRDYLRRRDDAVCAALMVHVGYWASGLFSFSFWSAWWQVSYLLLMAVALAGRAGGRAPRPEGPGPPA
ncbi:MAG: O-antigen ligase family protein [Proteobacteria bacterium]|nr:O-antigen ligase family protein [Pseudomonadota bacterium]